MTHAVSRLRQISRMAHRLHPIYTNHTSVNGRNCQRVGGEARRQFDHSRGQLCWACCAPCQWQPFTREVFQIIHITDAMTQENEPSVFSYAYTGRKLGLDAIRTFRFTRDDSLEEGTRTLFTHFASWEGYAAVMFWSWSPIRAHVKSLFEGFQTDLKRAAEK